MAKRGKIASPKFPYTYPLNIECEWLIKASPGNQLLIEFNQLDVDSSEHCNEDYVELRNTNERGQIIGKLIAYQGGQKGVPNHVSFIFYRSVLWDYSTV